MKEILLNSGYKMPMVGTGKLGVFPEARYFSADVVHVS